jgi:hypothetical protein
MEETMNYTMIHITRHCCNCGNLTPTKILPLGHVSWAVYGEVASRDWVQYPVCPDCAAVLDDYGNLYDYDDYEDDEDFYYVPYYCAGCGMRVYPPDDEWCICYEEE